jgi:hypothetical protein
MYCLLFQCQHSWNGCFSGLCCAFPPVFPGDFSSLAGLEMILCRISFFPAASGCGKRRNQEKTQEDAAKTAGSGRA